MEQGVRRAVAASASRTDAQPLAAVLSEAGFEFAAFASGGPALLRAISRRQPELVLADAILPGLDGLRLAERVSALSLNLYPSILLMRLPGCPSGDAARLRALGAAYLDKPPTAAAIRAAEAALAADRWRLPPDRAARLEALLDALGVPEHLGRRCLICAVGLVRADRRRLRPMKAGLYPETARVCGCTPAQAERAIRHAIDAAWRSGEIEQQHRIFGDTIDARRGRPTCGEMIAQLADILRWEGRQ